MKWKRAPVRLLRRSDLRHGWAGARYGAHCLHHVRQYGRIADRQRDHVPVPRPAPLAVWQLDFKDVSTVPADPHGKRQHVVEVLNTVDMG